MIRTIRRLVATDGGDNKEWIELTTLSSDTKPTSGIINGSIATEVDTGKVFFFDETAGEWVEQFSFQNAGGGGGVLVANVDPQTQTIDKTWQEVHDAMTDGKIAALSLVTNVGGTEYATTTMVYGAVSHGGSYQLMTQQDGETVYWEASSADGYPVREHNV